MMCFKINKQKTFEYSPNVAILNAINRYPNASHNLNGCIPDITLASEKLKGDMQIRWFTNYEVTRKTVTYQLEKAIYQAKDGDNIIWQYSGHGSKIKDRSSDEADGYDETLYVYDGHLVDDDLYYILSKINKDITVVMILDSCYSGTATRALNAKSYMRKQRYVPESEIPFKGKRPKHVMHSHGNWISMSACGEHQTASDALLDTGWNGIFSYYLWNTYNRSLTYKQWFSNLRRYLPDNQFDQIPELDGPDKLIDKLVLT